MITWLLPLEYCKFLKKASGLNMPLSGNAVQSQIQFHFASFSHTTMSL